MSLSLRRGHWWKRRGGTVAGPVGSGRGAAGAGVKPRRVYGGRFTARRPQPLAGQQPVGAAL